jgi:hypothetical protein
MKPTSQILRKLEGRIWTVLTVRQAIWSAAVWFFVLGVFVLAVRMLTHWPTHYLVAAVAIVIPIVAFIALRQWRQRPVADKLRSLLDRHNEAGGMVVAEGTADMKDWESRLPKMEIPEFRWRSRRPLTVFTCSAVFLAVTFLLPEKHLGIGLNRNLEIGGLVGEISEEIGVLEEEEILDEDRAEDLQEQLNRLEKDASAQDPVKTWEALDHLKEANSQLAKQAAEEALKKIEALKQSETLAGALGIMPEPNEAVEARGMQDLAAMLAQAALEEGLLDIKLPEDLLQAAKDGKLTPEDLKKLLAAIKNNKEKLGECIGKLSSLKLIDPSKLGECNKAGSCPNPAALAAFLCKECSGTNNLAALVKSYCRGGVSRGRGDAPITWKDPSSFDGTKTKDQVLPTGTMSGMENAQFVGISRSAPEVTGVDETAGQGALGAGQAGGGSAQVHQVLPRHKGAVKRFFKRED